MLDAKARKLKLKSTTFDEKFTFLGIFLNMILPFFLNLLYRGKKEFF